jgi:hypothetical protein
VVAKIGTAVAAQIEIPLVDIGDASPVELVRMFPERAHALANAAKSTFGVASRAVAAASLPLADRASRNWLERANNPYQEEIKELAAILGIRGAWFLNVCFEWACTTGVWETEGGPLLRRVLDWPFPKLGENIVVARHHARAGFFLNMTWPGFNGVLQAMAPDRFAAAINQAPIRRRGTGYAGDWLQARIAVSKSAALPPAHLLRRVFETAANYAAAKDLLCHTPIAVPAIFILSGAAVGEGCVIERTENTFALRTMESGRVCAGNHFEAHPRDTRRGWRPRPIDSMGRAECARGLPSDLAGFDWFISPIANAHSRLVFTANAASHALALKGVHGTEAVTQTLTLAA